MTLVKLLAPDGELLAITDQKKAEWYVKKGLGDLVEDSAHAFIVKLKFEPQGRIFGIFKTRVRANFFFEEGAGFRTVKSQGQCYHAWVVMFIQNG